MKEKYKDEEWLQEKYVDDELTLKEMSELCSAWPSTIYGWMNKYGISSRSKQAAQLKRYGSDPRYRDKEWLKEKYINNNMTTAEIGKLVDVSKATIGKWLKSFDIELRENKPRERRKKVKCDWCEKEIFKSPSRLKEYDHYFCSRNCFYKWESENNKGSNCALWKGGKVEVKCEYCDETYKVTPSRKGESRFCSRECYQKWQSDNLSGANSYQWKGGVDEYTRKRINADGDWRKNRKKALKRDNEQCQFCNSKNNLEVHHILPVRDGGTNNIGNLITLCRVCHMRTERNCDINDFLNE